MLLAASQFLFLILGILFGLASGHKVNHGHKQVVLEGTRDGALQDIVSTYSDFNFV